MTEKDISKVMEAYIEEQEMSCGILYVRKNDKIVYHEKWGYSNLKSKTPVSEQSIFRMASMTKCVIGAAIMKLIEEGQLTLDDPISKYIPHFSDMNVADDSRYQGDDPKKILLKMPLFRMDKVKTVPAQRQITIRDLLSHASGLEQGWVGMLGMLKLRDKNDTLKKRAERYAEFALDFQPGTATSYSPCAGFDILSYLIQLITGENTEAYLKRTIFKPLEMYDAAFWLSGEQERRLVCLYKRKGGKLKDISGTKEDLDGLVCRGKAGEYTAGCGGLYCTASDYEHFARMLCNEGMYKGREILKASSVRLMHTEAQEKHLETEPGFTWGLSVKIRQEPERGGSFASAGTYGWSGAYGTHFFVSPKDNMEAVFVTNRGDLGGSGSFISQKVEEMVFSIWGQYARTNAMI